MNENTHASSGHIPASRLRLAAWTLFASVLGLAAATADAAPADVAAGRVVAIHGAVSAQAPGQAPRALRCGDPVYPGDRVVSDGGAGVGVLSGGVYTGLDENTALAFETTERGAPMLSLEVGHLRVLDAAGEAPTRISTPGLLAYEAGGDTEAFAFREKAWTVSMICPWDDSVGVVRHADRRQGARLEAGRCGIDKPHEPLFTADASHAKLPITESCPSATVAGRVADRFATPVDVALGLPAVGAAGPSVGPPISSDPRSIRTACDSPGACSAGPAPTITLSGFPSIGPP